MTEDEAKEKWCHVATSNGAVKCCGADCMAWRWTPLKANTPEYIAALKQCESERGMKPKDAAKYVLDNMSEFGLPTEPFDGYCGLAGKPEVR